MSNENKIVKVGFHGGEIEAIKQGEDVFVSVRRACEHIGLASNGQIEKLKEKEWSVHKFLLSTGPDGKMYENFMLHLDSVPMWLATIDTSRVKNESRPVLIAYQKEAAKLLRDHFFKQVPTPSYSDSLRLLADRIEENERLEAEKSKLLLQAKKDEPFINVGRSMLSTESSCKIGDFVKAIKINGKVIGPKKVFKYLRNKGVLFKNSDGNNMPYQSHITAGRFIVRQGKHYEDGKEIIHHTTLITPKGQGYVINLMVNDKDMDQYTIEVNGKNPRNF